MSIQNSGSATVNGVQQPQAPAPDADTTKNAQHGQPDAQNTPTQPEAPKNPANQPQPENSVPYSRFREVVEARKTAEDTLAAVVEEVVATLPEEMRSLVPNLPPAEKIRWINAARQKGFFVKSGSGGEPDSPGSKRPGGKQSQDIDGLNAMQKLQFGFGRKDDAKHALDCFCKDLAKEFSSYIKGETKN